MKKIAAVLLTVALGFSVANAEVLPDQVDLKAAYCLPVLQAFSSKDIEDGWPEDAKQSLLRHREKQRVDLRRLQLYLFPRLSYLDRNSLTGARKSGEEDYARFVAELKTCAKGTSSDFGSCVKTETFRRLGACDDLSFLPF